MADKEYRDNQFRSGYKTELEQVNPQLDTLTSLSKAMAAQIQSKPKEKAPLRIGKTVKIIVSAGGAAAVIALAVILPYINSLPLSQSEANTVYCGEPESVTATSRLETADEGGGGVIDGGNTIYTTVAVTAPTEASAADTASSAATSEEIGSEDIAENKTCAEADDEAATEAVSAGGDLLSDELSSCEFIKVEDAQRLWSFANNQYLYLTPEQLGDLWDSSLTALPLFESISGESGTYTVLIDIICEPRCKLFAGVYFNGSSTKALKYAVVINQDGNAMTVENFLSFMSGEGSGTADWEYFGNPSFAEAFEEYNLIY